MEHATQVQRTDLGYGGNMERVVKYSFPKTMQVTDRFPMQKLTYDEVQEMRIKIQVRSHRSEKRNHGR